MVIILVYITRVYNLQLSNMSEIEKKQLTAREVKSRLLDPKLYDLTILLLKRGYKIFVLLIGESGSGKSTTRRCLLNDLNKCGVNHSLYYSLDDLEKFTVSDSQFKILELNQFKGANVFLNSARNYGYISLILEVGKSENKIPYPLYYGVFVSSEEFKRVFGCLYKYTQTTPLHITCHYVGGSKKKGIPQNVLDKVGKPTLIRVIGLSKNQAGDGLVVQEVVKNGFVGIEEKVIPHITLSTNEKFKPVDVGKKIDLNNLYHVVNLDGVASNNETNYLVLNGIYSPTW